jgi:Na+-driven multidrug efflux pump/anti-sigma regulatory factor (Ser/Thr protein kinase)
MKKNAGIINKLYKSSVIGFIVAAVAALLGVLIDGIVIGRFLGPDSMAAYSLVTPIINLTSVFSGVFSTGAQVVCAERIGAGDVKGTRRVFSVCMIATVAVSIVLVAGILLFRDQIAVLLGATGNSAHLLKETSEYMLGLVFSLPCLILLFTFNTLMRIDGDANRVVIAVGVMTVLDIAGDLLNALVFKKGMLGMGLATTFSYLVAVIILFFHFTKKDILLKFSFKGVRWTDLRDILATGSSSAVGNGSAVLRNTTLNHIMVATILSGTAVGAFGIVNSIIGFAQCVMIGVGLTTSMIAGMILGEQDRSGLNELVKTTLKAGVIIGAIITVPIFIFAKPIAAAFGNKDGAEMVALAARGIRIYSVSIILYGLNNAFVNYTQGLRRMGYSIVFCFFQNFLFIAIPALALVGVLDTDAVWFSFIIGECTTMLSIFILAGIQKKGFPFRIKDFLFVPKTFGVPESESFEVSISDISEVPSASVAIRDFSAGKGATKKEQLLLSLFTEEIGNNIANYGFEEGKGQSLDIRVIHAPDGWILRLRDNCKMFDPTDWAQQHENADPTKNIGIRMVCNMAKESNYLNSMDLNVLTLKI